MREMYLRAELSVAQSFSLSVSALGSADAMKGDVAGSDTQRDVCTYKTSVVLMESGATVSVSSLRTANARVPASRLGRHVSAEASLSDRPTMGGGTCGVLGIVVSQPRVIAPLVAHRSGLDVARLSDGTSP